MNSDTNIQNHRAIYPGVRRLDRETWAIVSWESGEEMLYVDGAGARDVLFARLQGPRNLNAATRRLPVVESVTASPISNGTE